MASRPPNPAQDVPGTWEKVQITKDLVAGDLSSDPGSVSFSPRGGGITSVGLPFLIYSRGTRHPPPDRAVRCCWEKCFIKYNATRQAVRSSKPLTTPATSRPLSAEESTCSVTVGLCVSHPRRKSCLPCSARVSVGGSRSSDFAQPQWPSWENG